MVALGASVPGADRDLPGAAEPVDRAHRQVAAARDDPGPVLGPEAVAAVDPVEAAAVHVGVLGHPEAGLVRQADPAGHAAQVVQPGVGIRMRAAGLVRDVTEAVLNETMLDRDQAEAEKAADLSVPMAADGVPEAAAMAPAAIHAAIAAVRDDIPTTVDLAAAMTEANLVAEMAIKPSGNCRRGQRAYPDTL